MITDLSLCDCNPGEERGGTERGERGGKEKRGGRGGIYILYTVNMYIHV